MIDPASGSEHFALTIDAIVKFAEFWAFLRQSGIPTSSADALDPDAILRAKRPSPANLAIRSPSL